MIRKIIQKTFCRECNLQKTLEEMVSNAKYGPGYKYLCKACEIKLAKFRRTSNPEKAKNQTHEFYIKHRDTLLYKKKIKAKTSKEQERRHIYNLKYNIVNKQKHTARNRLYNKTQYLNDPFFRLKKKISHRIRASLRNKGFIKGKGKHTWLILGTDKEGLRQHFLITQNIDILDLTLLRTLEVDHICPLAQAQDEKEILKLNHYLNLQLLTRKQNRVKSDRKTIEAIEKCIILLNREWIDHE